MRIKIIVLYFVTVFIMLIYLPVIWEEDDYASYYSIPILLGYSSALSYPNDTTYTLIYKFVTGEKRLSTLPLYYHSDFEFRGSDGFRIRKKYAETNDPDLIVTFYPKIFWKRLIIQFIIITMLFAVFYYLGSGSNREKIRKSFKGINTKVGKSINSQ